MSVSPVRRTRQFWNGLLVKGRVLLTQDSKTTTKFAFDRIRSGLSMPGVIEVRRNVPIAVAMDELLVIAECSYEREWEGQVLYVPLR